MSRTALPRAPALLASLALALISTGAGAAQPARAALQPTAKPAAAVVLPSERIVAIVNGEVISQADVENRGRLFAMSTGLPVNPEVLVRLRPQVTQQLIDERLRLQEEQRRKIVVTDKEIATSIDEIEKRNGMEAGNLRRKLGEQGVALRTLIDQVRVQIGWSRVLRDELGDKLDISDADVAEQMAQIKAQTGQPEFRVAEIFPADRGSV